jgi:hypothetical protein
MPVWSIMGAFSPVEAIKHKAAIARDDGLG